MLLCCVTVGRPLTALLLYTNYPCSIAGLTCVCIDYTIYKCMFYVTDSGSLFYVAERGSCRCVRGEVVCAKSPFKMIPKEGKKYQTDTPVGNVLARLSDSRLSVTVINNLFSANRQRTAKGRRTQRHSHTNAA